MENTELKISVKNAIEAYNGADNNGKKMLEALFGQDTFRKKDIKDRVKTFEDAVMELGNDNQAVIDYYAIADKTCTPDILAFGKLRVITETLNEGWRPQLTEDEYRYFPYFYLYTEEEWKQLSDDEQASGRVLGRPSYSGNVYGGVAFAIARYASSYSSSSVGSRLAFKSRELAEYCGKQFIDIWFDFMFERKEETECNQ